MADEETVKLLSDLQLESLVESFKENQITIDVIPLLSENDIKELIKHIGPRAIFMNYWKTKYKSREINLEDRKRKHDAIESPDGADPLNTSQPLSKIALRKNLLFSNILQINSLDELITNAKSKEVLNVCKEASKLDEKLRKQLCLIVVSEIENREEWLDNNVAQHLATLIVKQFPTEALNKWFVPPIKKSDKGTSTKSLAATGKILGLWRNRRNKYSELKKRNIKENNTSQKITNLEFSVEIKLAVEWLRVNQHPWATVHEKWRITFEARQQDLINLTDKTITNIITKWPLFKHPQGYEFILKDFKLLYNSVPDINIDCFKNVMLTSMDCRRIYEKDTTGLNLKKQLNLSATNEDSIVAQGLMLLCHLFPSKTVHKKSGSKSAYKASIAEAKDSFIQHVKIANDVENIKEAIINRQKKESIQPFLIVVGETLLNINEIFISIDDIIYKVPDMLQAFDICFKAFHIFQLKYPKSVEHIWLILQKGIYKMSTKYDKIISHIADIIHELEKPATQHTTEDSEEKIDTASDLSDI